MSDNNGAKVAEVGLFLTSDGLGVGWGVHHEDRRWENEIKVSLRTDWKGLKDFFLPNAWSAWKKKEVAHETWYTWGFASVYVDIPDIKATSRLLSQ